MKIGTLTVVGPTGQKYQTYLTWNAVCSCGHTAVFPSYHFVRTKKPTCKKCFINVRRPRKPDNQSHINYLMSHVRNSARQRDIGFSLTVVEAKRLFEGDCTYCGVQPRLRVTCKNLAGMYAWNGIDRIDSSVGYITGNVVSCCPTCNVAKLDMTLPEFMAWIKRVHQHMFGRTRAGHKAADQMPLDLMIHKSGRLRFMT